MSIVFGWYSFKIKSYAPEDLNIENENKRDVSFEIRQQCFHFFWIPFCGLGKLYVLRKEGELYELPDDIIALMKSKGAVKSPWYTFSFPILAVLGFFGFFVDQKIEDYQRYQYQKGEFEYVIGKIDNELSRLTSAHYLKIRNLNKAYETEGMYLKVVSVNDTLIRCSKVETALADYDAYPFVVKAHYEKSKHALDTFTYSINELKRAICWDYSVYSERQKFGVNLFGDNDQYVIEAVEYIDGPVIKNRGTGYWSYGEFSMDFYNHGAPAELVEIRNLEGNIDWKEELPKYIPTDSVSYSNFALKGLEANTESKYKFLLVFKDAENRLFDFIVEGKGWERSVERVVQ